MRRPSVYVIIELEHLFDQSDMPFSTHDRDNDNWGGKSCSRSYGGYGGWWFNKCGDANLNAYNYAYGKPGTVKKRQSGINWGYITDLDRSRLFKAVTMSIRPNNV